MTLFEKIRMYKRQKGGALVKAKNEEFMWEDCGQAISKSLARCLKNKPWLLVQSASYHDGLGWKERAVRWRYNHELLAIPQHKTVYEMLKEHARSRSNAVLRAKCGIERVA